MPSIKQVRGSGTAASPPRETVNFAGCTVTDVDGVTTVTPTGAETVTVQTATTSVLTPIVDAIAAGALSLAPTTATSITVGQTMNLAANKNIACAAGTTAVDLSLGTGTFKTPTGIHTFGGKLAAGATVNVIADPGNAGAIAVTTSGVCNITTGGAETRTLAIPTFVGQRLTICMDVDGGDGVITVASAYNQAGNTIITLNDAGDTINLVGAHIAGARRWRIVNNDGCTLS